MADERIYFVDHNTKSCQWGFPGDVDVKGGVDADTQTDDKDSFLIISSSTNGEGSNDRDSQKTEKDKATE